MTDLFISFHMTMSGLRSVLAICGGKVNDDWSGRSAMMEWLYRWEMLLEEIEDNLEDFVMPDVIPPQVECCRTVAQHMSSVCLSPHSLHSLG